LGFIIWALIWYNQGMKIRLSQEDINDLYHLTDYTDKFLRKKGIDYAINCGTLLGSVRDQGLIPWDHDVDILVFEKDIERLKEASKELPRKYKLDGSGITWAIHYKNVHIDLWNMTEIEENKYHYTKPTNQQTFSTEWMTYDEIYPLREYQFGPLRLKGPNKHLNYLKRVYGVNWMYPSHYQTKKDKFFCILFSWINKLRGLKTKCALPNRNIT